MDSLAPRRFEQNFRQVIFKLISVTDGWGISCNIALRWMPLDLTNDKSTLVQVMAWCHHTTSHYLNQCWPRSLPPYGVTRPRWVNHVWWDIIGTHLNDINSKTHPARNITHAKIIWFSYAIKCFRGNYLRLQLAVLWQSSRNHVSTSALSDVEFKCQT